LPALAWLTVFGHISRIFSLVVVTASSFFVAASLAAFKDSWSFWRVLDMIFDLFVWVLKVVLYDDWEG
jgi:hypothetical protein